MNQSTQRKPLDPLPQRSDYTWNRSYAMSILNWFKDQMKAGYTIDELYEVISHDQLGRMLNRMASLWRLAIPIGIARTPQERSEAEVSDDLPNDCEPDEIFSL